MQITQPAVAGDESSSSADDVPAEGLVSGGKPDADASADAPAESPLRLPAAEPASPAEIDRLFELAVREHSRRLLGIARAIVGTRASPEDIVQQALVNLYQHRARYDWNDPGGLLRRTVVNESLRILRQPRPTLLMDETPSGQTSPLTDLVNAETIAKVRQAIDRLPPHFRSALVLCEYEQMSYVQIASALGATIPQVKTWIFRARRQLEQALKEK